LHMLVIALPMSAQSVTQDLRMTSSRFSTFGCGILLCPVAKTEVDKYNRPTGKKCFVCNSVDSARCNVQKYHH
jgi:hypothetical protein